MFILIFVFLLGIIFYPNEEGDVMDIQADIIGPRKYTFWFRSKLNISVKFIAQKYWPIYSTEDTPFHGGIFRCKLVIDNEFPSKPPKGFFLTKIFHPNVNGQNGDICVNTLKRDWNPQSWSLSHIF